MDELEHILKDYAAFEAEVRAFSSDLKKVRYSRFQERLSEARNAFDVLQLFFSANKLENDAMKVLAKISRLI